MTPTNKCNNDSNNNSNSNGCGNSSCSKAQSSTSTESTAGEASSWAQEFLAKQKLEREKQILVDLAEKKAKIQKRIDQLRQNKHTQDRPTKKRKFVRSMRKGKGERKGSKWE